MADWLYPIHCRDAKFATIASHIPHRSIGSCLGAVVSRRSFVRNGLASLAGVSLACPLQHRSMAATSGGSVRKNAVILVWLSGGPSHLDTFDPKPEAPIEIRGPFDSIGTSVPGVQVGEHLPLLAGIMDRLALIRSVDCRASMDHFPAPMQAGNPSAQRSKVNPYIGTCPSMGAVAARFCGPNDPTMPAYAGVADMNLFFADILGAAPMGGAYEAVDATHMSGRLSLPPGVSPVRVEDRAGLCQKFDRQRSDLDIEDRMVWMDHYRQQALQIVLSGKAEKAFRVDLEPERLRDAYGRHSLGERTLLARRLVEAGVTYVTVSGTYGMFDNHGDDHFAGGLVKGLKPLLGRVDQAVHALITDLEVRGLLSTTLVLVMGEFGRGPVVNKNGGRDHWMNCMSMLVAGGDLAHGQVIGSTDAKGYDVQASRVTPSDLAATVFRHLGINLQSQWIDTQGRPQSIVSDGGKPIPGLG